MKNTGKIDIRPDQLKILKLENRGLRKMAVALLDKSSSKNTKYAAVAAVSAMLIAMSDAPSYFSDKLDLSPQVSQESAEKITLACTKCEALSSLVEAGAGRLEIITQIKELFSIVEGEHNRLESFAKEQGARLIESNLSPRVGGTGGKEPPLLWLNRLLT